MLTLKLRPFEKFLADFGTSALLKALKINLLFTLKNADGQAFRSAEVRKYARDFSHDLNLNATTGMLIVFLIFYKGLLTYDNETGLGHLIASIEIPDFHFRSVKNDY